MAKTTWQFNIDGAVHTAMFEEGDTFGRKTLRVDGAAVPLEPAVPKGEVTELPFAFGGKRGTVHIRPNGLISCYGLSLDGRRVPRLETAVAQTAHEPSYLDHAVQVAWNVFKYLSLPAVAYMIYRMRNMPLGIALMNTAIGLAGVGLFSFLLGLGVVPLIGIDRKRLAGWVAGKNKQLVFEYIRSAPTGAIWLQGCASLLQFGPEIIPDLLNLLAPSPPPLSGPTTSNPAKTQQEIWAENLRAAAAYCLGRLQVREAIPQILGALDDSDAGVRLHACDALGRLRASEAQPRIAELAEKDSDPQVRLHAWLALEHV